MKSKTYSLDKVAMANVYWQCKNCGRTTFSGGSTPNPAKCSVTKANCVWVRTH